MRAVRKAVKRIAASMVTLLTAGLGRTMALDLYVSPQGSDANPGTLARPFATPQQAQQAGRKMQSKVQRIVLHVP